MKYIKLFENFEEDSSHGYLNEASFNSFENNDDILTDKYIKDYIRSDMGKHFLDVYMEENDLEDEDSDIIADSSDFFSSIKDKLNWDLENAKDEIWSRIDRVTNKIRLFRAMTIDDNWLEHLKKDGKRLGVFWSWDVSGAITHWGDYSKKGIAIMEIEIDEKYIDWKDTFELDGFPNEFEEKEIRLFKNTPIRLKSLKINGTDIDVSIFGDKVFYS